MYINKYNLLFMRISVVFEIYGLILRNIIKTKQIN